MDSLLISESVLRKLAKRHYVDRREVEQCFLNREGCLLVDDREDHATDPPTLWFLAHTNANRLLKVVYIQIGGKVHLKSCYEPNADEIRIYTRLNNRSN